MGSVAYVTGYVIKPDQHSYADELMIQREFSCMSNGLGLSHLSPDMIDYYRNGYVNYVTMPDSGGKKRALPRYYREKLFTLREPFRQSLPTQEVTGYVYDLDEVYAYADWKRKTLKEVPHETNVVQIQESDRRLTKQQLLKRNKL